MMTSAEPVRSLVLWCPDWPITALGLSPKAAIPDAGGDREEPPPIAILHAGAVVACSASARREGVRRGQRRRDAQARCPSLRIVPDDPQRDHRVFLPLIDRLEKLAPGVQVIRPGLAAIRVRGPARYYGGEEQAARILLTDLLDSGVPDVRAGVADGPFTAEHAARSTRERAAVQVIPAGAAAAFLSPLPITTLQDPDLVALLVRLGVRTLGEFAALEEDTVRDRFSERGTRLHALAGGRDSQPVTPRIPPPELTRRVEFEPPLEIAEQVAFGVRQTCDDVVAALGAAGLVCTELRVELTDESGGRAERVWLHPTFFSAAEMVDRVRWQLEAAVTGDTLTSAVQSVRLVPEAVDAATHHAPGLFGQGPGERVHHALSRVQAMLGHRGVLVPAVGGGRFLRERQLLVPWGDRPPASAGQRDRPWPGSLPDPLPATVFAEPVPVEVTDSTGERVRVDDRGTLSGTPAALAGRGIRTAVTAWAGPWPVRERQWDAARRRDAHRFQLVDQTQTAWLAVFEDDAWHAEGRYD